MVMECRRARSTIFPRADLVMMAPVGFWGLLTETECQRNRLGLTRGGDGLLQDDHLGIGLDEALQFVQIKLPMITLACLPETHLSTQTGW